MKFDAPGLPADWLNGWLAAVGAVALLPDVRLSWTNDVTPIARFHVGGDDFPERLFRAIQSSGAFASLPSATAPHNITADEFERRARQSRRDTFLPALVTDLVRQPDEKLPRGEFNPPAQRGITIFARYERCRKQIASVDQIAATFEGQGSRAEGNGLGFDYRRLRAATYPGDPELFIEPVVECLCFAAMPLFPVRGSGARRARTRGWLTVDGTQQRGFVWGSWSSALDCWGVDALLDIVHRRSADQRELRRWGLTSLFCSVRYERRGSSDVSTGYASRRLW